MFDTRVMRSNGPIVLCYSGSMTLIIFVYFTIEAVNYLHVMLIDAFDLSIVVAYSFLCGRLICAVYPVDLLIMPPDRLSLSLFLLPYPTVEL
ncbi:hypothetical protein [Mesorhizobium sp.]|uniref:hypothetical protein n=1 Tax=Mesorhizobium sp. TaxID=1871066 RepID=UPI0025BD2804|nr:hypothetical protein [Mesorhizobium sp.]